MDRERIRNPDAMKYYFTLSVPLPIQPHKLDFF